MESLRRSRAFGAALALGVTLAAATAAAQDRSRYDGDPWDDDIGQTVARVAYISGQVSYSRGDDPDDWQPAALNFPMTLGDRIYTERNGRVELQLGGGAIYLAPGTDFAALNLTYDVKQFSLWQGSASFRIRRIDSGETVEVDTPNAAITLDREGDYRVDVDRQGNTIVRVTRGYAYVAAGGGEVPLGSGRLMIIDGIDFPEYDVRRLGRRDSWDSWVELRARRRPNFDGYRYVSEDIAGIADLDDYGRWTDLPGYGRCWSPSRVGPGWQPYRDGRWVWQDPWGWTWVSTEPWGWAPYHYGRWVNTRTGWYWIPEGRSTRRVRYAPALVAFVGGPGFSVSVSMGGGGHVGWFPLAPRDPFVPWWGSRRSGNDDRYGGRNVNYGNRAYVTVVDQSSFVSGRAISASVVRDPRTLRNFAEAEVVRGPIPVLPSSASIRVSVERGSAPRPPSASANRAVVTRLAPPPAPIAFEVKTNVIKENRGAPLAPADTERLRTDKRGLTPTRSVTVEEGRVTLTPKAATGADMPPPVPVTREVPRGQTRREGQPMTREPAPFKEQNVPAREREERSAPPPPNDDNRRKQQADQQQRQQEEAARRQQELDARRGRQNEQDRGDGNRPKEDVRGVEPRGERRGEQKQQPRSPEPDPPAQVEPRQEEPRKGEPNEVVIPERSKDPKSQKAIDKEKADQKKRDEKNRKDDRRNP
ncbi:MAG: hypothetical protein JNK60_04125 [Acidobacteria bacterium]|nr:hypothetical protein [Acidobacteriota bacterium]